MSLPVEAVVSGENDVPMFLLRIERPEDAWNQEDGRPGFARFTLYRIVGWDARPEGYGEKRLRLESVVTEVGGASELSSACRYAVGTVKWDGCCDWDLYPDGDGPAHACDADELGAVGAALICAYNLALNEVGT